MTKKKNDFSLNEIYIPNDLHQLVRDHTSGGGDDPQEKPFTRQIDFWFLGFAIAVKLKLPSENIDNKNATHIASGQRFNIEQVITLQLWGMAKFTGENILDPNKTISDASGYAAAGLRHITEMLLNNAKPPLVAILELIESIEGNS